MYYIMGISLLYILHITCIILLYTLNTDQRSKNKQIFNER